MDFGSLSVNIAVLREHLQLFALLLFALPLVSFLSFKFWVAARTSKTQRATNWFVPSDLDSESARMHYSMGHQSVAFARQARRNRRRSAR